MNEPAPPLDAIAVRLTRAGRLLLLVQCGRDGRCKRLGSGTRDNRDHDLHLCAGHPECFEGLLPLAGALWPRAGRVYDAADKPGDLMVLEISFFAPGNTRALTLRYGSDGAAPPDDVRALVALAVTLTDPWYAGVRSA